MKNLSFTISFTLGVIIGVILKLPYSLVFGFCSISLCGVCVLLLLYFQKGGMWVAPLCFSLGLFCAFCSKIGNIFEIDIEAAQRAYIAINETIKSLGFKDSRVGGLASALLTGYRENLDSSLVAAFRKAGAAHILALSGFHFGIIYLLVDKLLIWMKSFRVLWIVKALIIISLSIFYCIMCGGSPSLVRACIFIVLREIIRLCPGRKASLVSIFSASLLIQLVLNPQIILSISFQLSYLAVLGIILIYSRIKDWFEGKGIMAKIWNMAALSISCQITTFPIAWLRFRTFPQYFLISNLFALPLTSMFIFLVIISLVFGNSCPDFILLFTETIGGLLIRVIEMISLL